MKLDWIEKNYPDSLQILDRTANRFYHAMQYAWDFAIVAFADPVHQKSWTDAIKHMLLDNRIEELLRHFQLVKPNVEGEALLMLEWLMRYYQHNQHRKYYGLYKEKKLFIGSSAIESAHREVIQQRLKRSGQRWSKSSAQQIVQLRAAKKSNQWHKIINIAQFGKIAA